MSALTSAFLAGLIPGSHLGLCCWRIVVWIYDAGSALLTFSSKDENGALCVSVTSPESNYRKALCFLINVHLAEEVGFNGQQVEYLTLDGSGGLFLEGGKVDG